MTKFKELEKDTVFNNEAKILNKWEQEDILEQCMKQRVDAPNFVFYDGPATANGMPGIHHMVAKFLKDAFCKYKNMKGFRVVRKVGWDTHGLPVEIAVEKALGFKDKNDIEKYGIEAFNKKCKEDVLKNKDSFDKLTKEMGQFIDTKNPYITYDNSYIESEWSIFKKMFDANLIYEGHKILPYCIRCGTGLASHEVAQGYEEIDVNSVIVPMKLVDEDTYFLVWTTTPWTLISNVALCVNPKEEYILVESMGYKFILAKKLASSVLGDDYQIIKTYLGKDLEHKKYEQLLPFINIDNAFYVTNDEYVTMEEGTGIVHIAPAFGEDDYNIGKRYNLPVINPVNEEGRYTTGPWKDMIVFDADLEIIKWLKENNKLFKKIKVKHNYPHCWRCHTPLLYYSKPSWYIKVTAIKDQIIAANKEVNWYPNYVGEKRFANWLENINDWAISRSRYWGTPFPLWKCSCGHLEMIGSIAELKERSINPISDNIDLHRPFVDNIYIKCPVCGKEMKRVPDVVDCWFDSGSMPFSQYHYPFENETTFKDQFPADFIAEGIDQTRGWFYSLLVIGTFLTGKSPYKNVLVNDLLLDKNGQKMHKSKGNAIEPFKLIETYGADAIRWYIPYVSPVWTPIKFDEEGLKEVYSKFFNTLKNTYNFFAIYANTDNVDPREYTVNDNDLEEIDKWLLSKYHKLVKYVTDSYEEYDIHKVVRSITNFVSEDLSNWYIRRNRRRFWGSELDNSKKAVYYTTYIVLEGLTKLIAPVVPFISEEIFMALTGKKSVHLEDFPIYDRKYVNETIETKMDLVRNLITLGRNAREESKIKVRQPLSEVLIDAKVKPIINDLVALIMEELNVKQVVFIDDVSKYMDYTVKPNYKVAGPIFGSKIKDFTEYLQTLDTSLLNKLQNNETISYEGNQITKEMVDIKILAKSGFDVAMDGNNFVILDTELTKDLIMEGYAREIVSKIQNLRKTKDFNIIDRINIYYQADEEIKEAVLKQVDLIKQETLAINITPKDNLKELFDINNHDVYFEIEKVQ